MIKLLAPVLACALFVGVAPALADEAGSDPAEVPSAASLVVLVADRLGISPEELERLHEEGLGFGEIFRLKSLSQVLGLTIDEFLLSVEVDPETGEYDFDWEALRETLSEAQLAMLADLPKNLGEIVSAARRHHGRDEHQPDQVGGTSEPEDTDSTSSADTRGHKPGFNGKGGKGGRGH